MAAKTLEILLQASNASRYALDAMGRTMAPEFGAVSDNTDPNNLRRIRVTTEALGALSQTERLMRVLPVPGWDPPMPKLGDSVVVGFFQGNPHDGFYWGSLHNDTNPPFLKKDPWKDDSRMIPGDSTFLVKQNQIYGVGENWDIAVGKNLTLTVEGYRSETIKGDDRLLVGGSRCETIEGKQVIVVEGDCVFKVDENLTERANKITIEASGDVKIRNAAGASITLKRTGHIILKSGDGMTMPLGRLPRPPASLGSLDLSCGADL